MAPYPGCYHGQATFYKTQRNRDVGSSIGIRREKWVQVNNIPAEADIAWIVDTIITRIE